MIGSVITSRAQEKVFSKNSVFYELFGNGGFTSFNYERRFKANLCGRIGLAHWKTKTMFGGTDVRITAFPILVTYFTGTNASHFEVSGGVLIGNKTDYTGLRSIFDLTSFVGYRYQAPGRGFLFRIGLTPFLSVDNDANYPDSGLGLSGGISLGYHF